MNFDTMLGLSRTMRASVVLGLSTLDALPNRVNADAHTLNRSLLQVLSSSLSLGNVNRRLML